jgi:hypothetical protein
VVDAFVVFVIVEREASKVETDRCVEVEGSFPCPHRSSVVYILSQLIAVHTNTFFKDI